METMGREKILLRKGRRLFRIFVFSRTIFRDPNRRIASSIFNESMTLAANHTLCYVAALSWGRRSTSKTAACRFRHNLAFDTIEIGFSTLFITC